MTVADRIGDWSLRHPMAVLTAFASIGGLTLGYNTGGAVGAVSGLTIALALSTYLTRVDTPHPPSLGPQQ